MPAGARHTRGIPISARVDANRMSAELPPSTKTRRTSQSFMTAEMTRASWWGRLIPAASSGPKVTVALTHEGSSVGGEELMCCTCRV